ncbi:GNAT family N-acetyltransferase [Alteriqipengyuania lutimaris]|uniref:GNAT family N-acetyltransferase n=1 Tax=Alteriqipengyuania lutimaris TaxID=1538146 RepID=A0A395LJG1_9SPHN|nr:GNAT family N-acetyltransferase [Alteriqipengyuania lutimaris]MBB3033935.1 CelD/BcsL family acetyltransferase involved in cellulose biosynthesis [Alteriqipengyuania lutimaris]RDS77108.1 GNAT family N-acetyltransferase [Alteriqipengyuania lutimaris]
MTAQPTSIDFTIGSRRLFRVERSLRPIGFSLEDALADTLPRTATEGADGLRVQSAPAPMAARLLAAFPDHIAGAREDFRRHYILMDGSFEDYLARFSGKTRSTLRRKVRKFATADGGDLDVRAYTSPGEVARFLDLALPLSEKTYQARLLDAGLPDSEDARKAMLAAAEAGQMRCFLLFLHGEPVAYLALPVRGDTLVYAHLGYDPAHGALSPGTVLQMEALRMLFAEERFRFFDFTEGEGAHKALFGTHSIDCCSFVLLRRTLANRLLLSARDGFDAGVERIKRLAERSGSLASARKLLRA